MSRWSRRYNNYGGGSYWPPYVPVATRRANAQKEIAALAKKGEKVAPVRIEGRSIARTFWGKSWCTNLESYADYSNRLPRGRTYVCNGSVIDLRVERGQVHALVMGSELYRVKVTVRPVDQRKWKELVTSCAGRVESMIELLQGKLSHAVMETVTRPQSGLFPSPREIEFRCSCPDSAMMCKHVAAALYGVGARLDEAPQMLFTLRGADPAELVVDRGAVGSVTKRGADKALQAEDQELADLFGIEMGDKESNARDKRAKRRTSPARAQKPTQSTKLGAEKPTQPAKLRAEKPTQTTKLRADTKTQSAKPTGRPAAIVRAAKPEAARALRAATLGKAGMTRAKGAATAKPKAAPAATNARKKNGGKSDSGTISQAELESRGVADSVVEYWLRTGMLRRGPGSGTFEMTPEVVGWLARYAPATASRASRAKRA